MNDLERLVRRLPLPEPSADLDRAIFGSATGSRRRTGFGQVAALLATAACTGLLGFVLGRQTVAAPRNEPARPPASARVSASPDGVREASIMRVELPAESLSAFAAASSRPLPPWGDGPVTFRVIQSDR